MVQYELPWLRKRLLGWPELGNISFLLGDSLVDFALKVVQWSESETVRLQLWDIAGQERFTSMTRLYYREASACIIMFDVTNISTFSNSQKWKQDLDSKLMLPDGNPVPCLLLANKCDLSPWAVTRDEKNINESMRVLIEKMMSSSTGDGSSSAAGSGDYINIKETTPPGWACC
ncbi:PREDICTED: ras-related protein Rab-7L1 [Pygoscelis adeliae]|uniref:ras-related protein Rab-7L1 n=1 Tax=Pygoscelis adeliae TaxID=9238 RepID=UPI0004F4E896|nr:PREDICTED: ras-related protein Rab-7L1 [Pygoscelis adeliae]